MRHSAQTRVPQPMPTQPILGEPAVAKDSSSSAAMTQRSLLVTVHLIALLAMFQFFACVYTAKKKRADQGSKPLAAFGAVAAAIIATVTLLHGALVMIPAFLW